MENLADISEPQVLSNEQKGQNILPLNFFNDRKKQFPY